MKEKKMNGFIKFVIFYVIATVIIVILSKTVFMINIIPSGSMEGTIMTGDILYATRLDKTEVERYDIMTFIPPDEPDTYYIKRVIGLPGETVTVRDGSVYVDGKKIEDSFIKEEMNRSGDGTYVVPENCYFMMGDNRNCSLDSRFWNEKYVPLENMVAKNKVRIFPFRAAGAIS